MWQIYTQDSILKGLNTCLRMEQWSIYNISQDIGLQRRLREYIMFSLPISMLWQVDLLGRTSTYKEELNVPRGLDTEDSCTLPQAYCAAVAARGVQPFDVPCSVPSAVPSAVPSVVSSAEPLADPSADLIDLKLTRTQPLAYHASMHKLTF